MQIPLLFGALLAPPVALFAPLGLTVVGLLVALGLVATGWKREYQRILSRPLIGFVILIAAWGFISALWALDPPETLSATARLLVIALAGIGMLTVLGNGHPSCRWVWFALSFSLGIAALFLLWDYVGHRRPATTWFYHLRGFQGEPGGQKSYFSRFASLLLLLMWPLALATARRWGRVWGGVVLLCAAAILAVGDSMAARIGVLLGMMAMAVVWWRPTLALATLRWSILAVILALPTAMHFVPSPQKTMQEWILLPLSAHHRLTIWSFAAERIAEKPWFGWGLNASRSIPGGDQEIIVTRDLGPDHPQQFLIEAMLPLHPHNAILQWWLELGAIGTMLMAAFIWWCLRRIENMTDRGARAIFAATFVAGLLSSAVSYGFWQNWWQLTLWIAAGFCLSASRTASPKSKTA